MVCASRNVTSCIHVSGIFFSAENFWYCPMYLNQHSWWYLISVEKGSVIELIDTISHGIILQYYSVTSKNIPSWCVWNHLPVRSGCLTSSGFMHQMHKFLLRCRWLKILLLVADFFMKWQLFLLLLPKSRLGAWTIWQTFTCKLSTWHIKLRQAEEIQAYHTHFKIYHIPSSSMTSTSVFPMHLESCCQWNQYGFPQLRRHSKCVEDMILMMK